MGDKTTPQGVIGTTMLKCVECGVRPGPKRLIVLTTNKQSQICLSYVAGPEQKQTNSNIKVYQNIATVVLSNCSAKIIISDQSYQTKAFIESNLGSLDLT